MADFDKIKEFLEFMLWYEKNRSTFRMNEPKVTMSNFQQSYFYPQWKREQEFEGGRVPDRQPANLYRGDETYRLYEAWVNQYYEKPDAERILRMPYEGGNDYYNYWEEIVLNPSRAALQQEEQEKFNEQVVVDGMPIDADWLYLGQTKSAYGDSYHVWMPSFGADRTTLSHFQSAKDNLYWQKEGEELAELMPPEEVASLDRTVDWNNIQRMWAVEVVEKMAVDAGMFTRRDSQTNYSEMDNGQDIRDFLASTADSMLRGTLDKPEFYSEFSKVMNVKGYADVLRERGVMGGQISATREPADKQKATAIFGALTPSEEDLPTDEKKKLEFQLGKVEEIAKRYKGRWDRGEVDPMIVTNLTDQAEYAAYLASEKYTKRLAEIGRHEQAVSSIDVAQNLDFASSGLSKENVVTGLEQQAKENRGSRDMGRPYQPAAPTPEELERKRLWNEIVAKSRNRQKVTRF